MPLKADQLKLMSCLPNTTELDKAHLGSGLNILDQQRMLCQKFTFLSTFLIAVTTSIDLKVDTVKVNKFAKTNYLLPKYT